MPCCVASSWRDILLNWLSWFSVLVSVVSLDSRVLSLDSRVERREERDDRVVEVVESCALRVERRRDSCERI